MSSLLLVQRIIRLSLVEDQTVCVTAWRRMPVGEQESALHMNVHLRVVMCQSGFMWVNGNALLKATLIFRDFRRR